jgi:hypothetical protein
LQGNKALPEQLALRAHKGLKVCKGLKGTKVFLVNRSREQPARQDQKDLADLLEMTEQPDPKVLKARLELVGQQGLMALLALQVLLALQG